MSTSPMGARQRRHSGKPACRHTKSALGASQSHMGRVTCAVPLTLTADAAEQMDWPLHRKWMKELYEARSSRAHRGPRSEFSRNWKDWQHIVIAAFTYPFAVKLRLSAAGLYHLNDKEMGACEALDALLDSHWGRGWRKPPEWSNILSTTEAARALRAAVEDAYRVASKGTAGRRRAGRARRNVGRRGYD
jgi:hypothetical protein